MLSIKLLESDAIIKNLINSAIAKEVDSFIKANARNIVNTIKTQTGIALKSCPEIQSLSSGFLRADFGLTQDPSDKIISTIVGTVNINIKRTRILSGKIEGGFIVTMQPSDYSNLLTLSAANQIINGGSLPWLKWLLTFGDSIIIANYGVEYGPFGRTGKARMKEKIGPFKVRSAFSGVIGDNFITRALKSNQSQIEQSIVKVLS